MSIRFHAKRSLDASASSRPKVSAFAFIIALTHARCSIDNLSRSSTLMLGNSNGTQDNFPASKAGKLGRGGGRGSGLLSDIADKGEPEGRGGGGGGGGGPTGG